jgi:hypothetical protein
MEEFDIELDFPFLLDSLEIGGTEAYIHLEVFVTRPGEVCSYRCRVSSSFALLMAPAIGSAFVEELDVCGKSNILTVKVMIM